MMKHVLIVLCLSSFAFGLTSKGAYQVGGQDKGAYQDTVAASCTPATYTGHAPRIDTLGFTGKIGFDSTGAVDSVHLRGWPAGATLLVDDTISYTWSAVTALSRCSTIVYSCDGESTITIDTLTIVSGLRLDSIRPVSGYGATSITAYGRNFGATQGSSTLAFGDSVPVPSAWSNTAITFPCPLFPVADTGLYSFIVDDGTVADTLVDAFHYLGPTACTPPTLSYTTRICTTGVAMTQNAITSGADSVRLYPGVTLPAGLSLTRTGANKGRVSGTATTATAKAGYRIQALGCDTVDAWDSLTVVSVATGTIVSFLPTSGKRNSTLTLACTSLMDSGATVRGRLNGVYCTLTRWASDTVKMTVPSWAPFGYYWPIIATVSGGDTTSLDTAATKFRVQDQISPIKGFGRRFGF